MGEAQEVIAAAYRSASAEALNYPDVLASAIRGALDLAGYSIIRTGELERAVERAAASERERLRPLVAQWRAAGEHLASSNAAWSSHFYDCANELERLIGAEGDGHG